MIQSARLVHWAQNDAAHRQVQIEVGVRHFKENMVRYAAQYGLDGVEDTVCVVVADIRHQGRARSSAILALHSNDRLAALLELGEPKYHARLLVLQREIKRLLEEGCLGMHEYSAARGDFVAKRH